ncbi:MAG: serine hydrolase, partial [Candidatus Cloacimonetes bacterium]|nr:serine hydrolase [Candidatus Cloacimonadota bacterium]
NTGEWVLNPETDMSVPGGAGAIVSTSSDLVLFIQALFKGELISAKSLEQMLKEKDGMSSGIFQLTIGMKTYLGHGGRIDSFNSLVIYSPADKHALAYLENGNADPNLSIIALVTGIMSNQQIILPQYQESIQKPELDSYLGTYTNSDIPMTISMMKIEDELYLQAEGQEKVKLQAIAMDTFLCNALDLKIVFSLDRKSFTLYQRGQTLQFVKKD